MTRHYRLIHFVPDHFSGERFPVGAIVAVDGSLEVAIADRTPGAECLGSDATYMLLRDTLDDIRQVRSFDSLPMAVGPHFELSETRVLPDLDVRAVKWVEENILPRRKEGERASRKRGPTRSTMGKEYLEQFGIGDYVSRFNPKRDFSELNGVSETLPSISQGVVGAGRMLLMEPIVPKRRQLDDDLKTVGQRFFSYRGALQTHSVSSDVGFLAYVLPGTDKDQREHIAGMLDRAADDILDMAQLAQRRRLVRQVTEVGESGKHQLPV